MTRLDLYPLLILIYLHGVQLDKIKMTTVQAGILPFEIGTARVISSYHTFHYHFNLNATNNSIKKLEDDLKKTKEICAKIKIKTLKENLEILSDKANRNLMEAKTRIKNFKPLKRFKRALTSEDDTEIENKLKTHIMPAIEQYRTILGQHGEALSKIFQNLQNQTFDIKNITTFLKYLIDNDKEDFNVYTTFISLLNLIDLEGKYLLDYLGDLDNAVMFANINLLPNFVMDHQQLENAIDLLENVYHFDNLVKFADSRTYYKLADVEVVTNATMVTFHVKFPIVEKEYYKFYELYSVPHNNITINVHSKYLGISEFTSFYHDAPCKRVEETYICSNPIFTVRDDCLPNYIKEIKSNTCKYTYNRILKSEVKYVTSDFVVATPDHRGMDVSLLCRAREYKKILEPTLFEIPKDCVLTVDTYQFKNIFGDSIYKPVILARLYDPEDILDKIEYVDIDKVVVGGMVNGQFFVVAIIFLIITSLFVWAKICLMIYQKIIELRNKSKQPDIPNIKNKF